MQAQKISSRSETASPSKIPEDPEGPKTPEEPEGPKTLLRRLRRRRSLMTRRVRRPSRTESERSLPTKQRRATTMSEPARIVSKQVLVCLFQSEANNARDPYRQKAFLTILRSLEQSPLVSFSREQFACLPGAGDGCLRRFDSAASGLYVLQPCANSEVDKHTEEEKCLSLFEGIYGVGKVKAADLYRKGYRKLSDIPASELNTNQMLGVRYYREINSRIPRKDIQQFERLLYEICPFDCRFLICGSYLRRKPDSGDVDVISTSPVIIDELVAAGYIKHILTRGAVKCLTLAIVNKTIRRVDFEIVTHESWPFAQIYFTGSAEFNKMCRQRAKDLGYVLNEKGLFYAHNGQPYPTTNVIEERDVFTLLGIAYVPPEKR